MIDEASSHYGLLVDSEEITYLHQGRASQNFIGLSKKSKIKINIKSNRACPHLVNGSAPVPDRIHWSIFLRILDDQLVQAMLPIPKKKLSLVPYIHDPQNKMAMLLVILSRMSSPIYPIVMQLDKIDRSSLLENLAVTNLSPLVLTCVQASDHEYIKDLSRKARFLPRKLILTGTGEIAAQSPLEHIDTGLRAFDLLMLASLPMEQLGAYIVKRFARGEVINAPLVTISALAQV